METQEREDGLLIGVAGPTRWGKSAWLKERIYKAPRILVRDPRNEYKTDGVTDISVTTISELAGVLREIGTGEGRVSFFGSDADFLDWCTLSYLWSQLWPAVIVAEEISSCTSAGKAPKEFGDLVRMGLYYGSHIYSVSQYPAQTDTTFWINASMIHCHGFFHDTAAAYMSRVMGVEKDLILNLEKYHFIERWAGEKELITGISPEFPK